MAMPAAQAAPSAQQEAEFLQMLAAATQRNQPPPAAPANYGRPAH
jgi:hypothetical protein